MKLKRIIIVILLTTICISQFYFISFNKSVYAEDNVTTNNNDTKYHYKQLTDLSKSIYNGMYDMYVKGILKTGKQDYDLTANGYITQSQIENYNNGNKELMNAMYAARYAFYADHPEIFYVNFSAISIRVTKDTEGEYHAYIGAGRYDDYYIEGFTNEQEVENAIGEFNNRVDEIVTGARNITVEEGKNLTTEQIKYVHNEIIYNTSYRLEDDCTPGNESHLSTPYGTLVRKQSVCEGYARAFKTILDKLGITCILVQGAHTTEGEATEAHMWNYVQIEENVESNARQMEKVWYAVDCTIDDPYVRAHTSSDNSEEEPGNNIVEGFENTRYLLVGAVTMNVEHFPIEEVESAGNYKFEYPELKIEDYGIDTVTNKDGLVVKYKKEGTETEEYRAGDYSISYNGKGYNGAAEDGYYLMMKSSQYKPGDQIWQESKWAYLIPDPRLYVGIIDNGDHIYISVANAEYTEFAVTNVPPGDYEHDITCLTYKGTEEQILVQSGRLYNPSGIYKAKPYIKQQSPLPTATLTVGPTYHVSVTYTDDLVFKEGETEVGYKMTSSGATGAEKSTITNFQWDGKRTITFDLKFSEMYADDQASYYIAITGLLGKNSGKATMEITYGAYNMIGCSFRMNKARNWEVFGRPVLLEEEDLSMKDWTTASGEKLSDKLKNRITLVATKTTVEQEKVMDDLVENEFPNQEIKSSQTYDISLNVCKKYVVKTGHRLRVALGFPAGYGPEDAGVTFKAYHFIRNDKNEVVGVEEIPCVVTQYGLIITCDSFSPYMIAVTDDDGTQNKEKAVIATSSKGGKITNASSEKGNIITLAENETKTITIKADNDYEIESVVVCGKTIDITNKETMEITVNYNEVTNTNNIIDVNFVSKAVVAKDVERGETVVQPKDIPVEGEPEQPGEPEKPEEPGEPEETIKSEKYLIGEGFISKIIPGTTIQELKTNVEASKDIIVKDKNGNALGENDKLSTGMTLQVGDTLQLTIIVTGDIDGTGEISLTDLAQLKLHYIEKEPLTGASLKAADINNDGQITITDLAQLKLVLVDLMELE